MKALTFHISFLQGILAVAAVMATLVEWEEATSLTIWVGWTTIWEIPTIQHSDLLRHL